jgi:hypothetical protein
LDPKAEARQQNAFCEGQDALYVEFFGRLGVMSISASVEREPIGGLLGTTREPDGSGSMRTY